jgi:YD repeat-containing protein
MRGKEEAADYDNRLALRSVTDPMGGDTVFNYQALEYPGGLGIMPAVIKSVVKPQGNIPYTQDIANIVLNGNEWPRVNAQTDAYGNTTSLNYDSETNVVTEKRPDNSTVTYEHYYNDGLPKTITDPTGKTTNITQTANEQISSITDRMGDTSTMTYHAQTGKLASYTDAEGHTTTYTYTADDQTFTNPANGETVTFTFYNLTRIDYADGTNEEFTYDPAHNGNILTHTDRAGKVWTYTYNSRGQVLTAANPKGGVTTYTYNDDATLASKNDPETGTTTYQYDSYKRLNRIIHPDGNVVQMAYNANDRLISITDERGRFQKSVIVQINENIGSIINLFVIVDQ